MTKHAITGWLGRMAPGFLAMAMATATACLCATPATGFAAEDAGEYHVEAYEPWPEATVDMFREVAVLAAGRVKPLDTFAQFLMLQLHGKRTMRLKVRGESGEPVETVKLAPTAWLMDVLFRPELAVKFPTFVVNDDAVIVALGITGTHAKRRDRYSYEELTEGRQRLAELGQEYGKIPPKERSRVQTMITNLAGGVSQLEYMHNQFAFAQRGLDEVDVGGLPEEVFGKRENPLSVVEMIEKIDKLREHLGGDAKKVTPAIQEALQLVEFYAVTGRGLNLFPPRDAAREEWYAPGELMEMGFDDEALRPWISERLNAIQGMVDRVGDEEGFAAAAQAFKKLVTADAEARGEYQRIGMEVFYYKGKFFYYAMILFVFGFVLVAITWLAPGSRFAGALNKAVLVLSVAGLASLVTGITLRCLIQNRPPIHNLYDTILFITATAVLCALFIELMNRQRLGLAVSVILGALGMFLSMRYEVLEAEDTIASVRAVLDSNFWLTTHVLTINIGYAAGLLAAAIAHIYIIGKFIGVREGDADFYRGVTRMTYGVVCFALFFSLVGTVLGGVWANDSWGRFWGWDPKENGALMIVLWSLAILHARMGGYIRELGINITSVVLGVIVSFSWWGVNLLGVGLHSYGFTEGVWTVLYSFWIVQAVVVGLGVVLWMKGRAGKGGNGQSGGVGVEAAAK